MAAVFNAKNICVLDFNHYKGLGGMKIVKEFAVSKPDQNQIQFCETAKMHFLVRRSCLVPGSPCVITWAYATVTLPLQTAALLRGARSLGGDY